MPPAVAIIAPARQMRPDFPTTLPGPNRWAQRPALTKTSEKSVEVLTEYEIKNVRY